MEKEVDITSNCSDPMNIARWDFVCDFVVDKIWSRDKKFAEAFAKAGSNEERVALCLGNEKVFALIKDFLEVTSSSRSRKHWEKAKEFRIEGNDWFKLKNYKEAIRCYNLAVTSAPYPTEDDAHDELSMALGNRSAALFNLKRYREALDDLDLALYYDYPVDKRHKLMIRKADCLKELGKYVDARKALQEALDLEIVKSDAKLKTEIEKMLNEIPEFDRKQFGTNGDNNPYKKKETLFVGNKNFPNASDSLEVKTSPEKGRLIVTNRDVKMGEILFKEHPLASVLLPDYYKTHCFNCYKNIDGQPISPCLRCNQIRFCHQQCEEESWQAHHKHECGFLNLLHEIGIAHLALRILLVCGLDNTVTTYNQLAADEYHYTNDYRSLLTLMDHADDFSVEASFRYSMTAGLLLILLDTKLNLIKPNNPNYKVIGGLLLKHIQQLIVNGHAISVVMQHDGQFVEDLRIATAIYPTVSLMNHSCIPNVTALFEGKQLTSCALKDLKQGEEVFNCYGPHWVRMPKTQRQMMLKEQYFFDCRCDACTDEGASRFDLARVFLCTSCQGPVVGQEDVGTCLVCHTTFDINKLENKLGRANQLIEAGVNLRNKKKMMDAEEKLLEAHEIMSNNLHPKNLSLGKAKDELCRLYALRSEWKTAVEFCRQSVEIVEELFGKNSLETCNELIKLSDLEYNLIDDYFDKDNIVGTSDKCLVTTSRAVKLLELLTSPSDEYGSEQIKRLKDRLFGMMLLDNTNSKIKNYLQDDSAFKTEV